MLANLTNLAIFMQITSPEMGLPCWRIWRFGEFYANYIRSYSSGAESQHYFQIFQLYRGLSSRVNIFARNISSTALTKFRQNRHFRQIRCFTAKFANFFGALLVALKDHAQPWAIAGERFHRRHFLYYRKYDSAIGELLSNPSAVLSVFVSYNICK